jgi:hypothetical protein
MLVLVKSRVRGVWYTFDGALSIGESPYHTDIKSVNLVISLPKKTGMSNLLKRVSITPYETTGYAYSNWPITPAVSVMPVVGRMEKQPL